MSLILRPTRTTQPTQPVGIDRGNGLTLGLGFAWTPQFVVDQNGNITATNPGNTSTAPTAVFAKYGVGNKYNASSAYWTGPGQVAETGGRTRFALLRVGSASSTRAILSNGGNGGCMLRITNNTDVVWVITGSTVAWTLASAVAAGEYCFLVVTLNADNISYKVYKNGVLLVSTTAANTAGSSGNLTPYVAQSGAASSYGDHEIYLTGSFNRELSASEVASLSLNPWQIFQPISRRIWMPSIGGGGGFTAVNRRSTGPRVGSRSYY